MSDAVCAECSRPVLARGLCGMHYQRARKAGALDYDTGLRKCACGCGSETQAEFKQGHNRRGHSTKLSVLCPCGTTVERKKCLVESGRAKYCSVECRIKYAPLTGEDHPGWKGDDVGYDALHDWVRRHKPRPPGCEKCGSVEQLDCANLSQKYKRDLTDWAFLCRPCHAEHDLPTRGPKISVAKIEYYREKRESK